MGGVQTGHEAQRAVADGPQEADISFAPPAHSTPRPVRDPTGPADSSPLRARKTLALELQSASVPASAQTRVTFATPASKEAVVAESAPVSRLQGPAVAVKSPAWAESLVFYMPSLVSSVQQPMMWS